MSENDFEIYTELLSSFKNSFDYLSVEQKRYYLKTFIKRVEWDGTTLNFYLAHTNEYKDDISDVIAEISDYDNKTFTEGIELEAAKNVLQMKY